MLQESDIEAEISDIMKNKNIFFIFLSMLLLLVMSNLGFANVIVFDNYKSTSIIEDGKIKVIIETNLKNTGVIPIIPGEIHLKLSNILANNNLENVNLLNYSVVGQEKDVLKERILVSNRETEIIFEVWQPILPNFFYPLKIQYEFEFKPKGIFFYQMSLPKSVTTIPIKNEVIEYKFPKNLYLTFAKDVEISKDENYRIITWTENKNVFFEVSRLPIPRMPFTISNIFWTAIIVLLAGILMHVSRMAKRAQRK